MYEFAEDSPIDAIDPNGLSPIDFDYNAFIPGDFGNKFKAGNAKTPEGKTLPGTWIDQPGSLYWETETNDRGFGGGSAKIDARGELESTRIGYLTPSDVHVRYYTSGSSRAEEVAVGNRGMVAWKFDVENAVAPIHSKPPVVVNTVTGGACRSTTVEVQAYGSYPWPVLGVVYGPAIVFDATFKFTTSYPDKIVVSLVKNKHTRFPDFEALLSTSFGDTFRTRSTSFRRDTTHDLQFARQV